MTSHSPQTHDPRTRSARPAETHGRTPAAPAWPPGTATGVGSMPGEDVHEAVRAVLDLVPDLPHLPELPGRGPGADLVGRSAGLLVDLAVDLQPSGWRLVRRPGADARRAASLLARDLDALEEHAGAYEGPLKVQVAGPWTLAAQVETERGGRVLADRGAVRDVAASLAEGVVAHLAALRRRVPGAAPVLQLDEPSLPAVLAGSLPTASGFARVPAVPEPEVTALLREAVETAAVPVVVHCCAPAPPVALCREAGASGVSLDATLLTTADDEALGEAVEAGTALWLGLVPTSGDPSLSSVGGTVAPVRALWRRLGLDPALLGASVVVTPACGLAGASPAGARAALTRAREAGRVLRDDPEG